MSAPADPVTAATDQPCLCAHRPARRGLLLSAAALAAGLLLLGLYVAWHVTAGTPSPILPPAGEALGGGTPFRFVVGGDSKDNMAIFEDTLARIKADQPRLIIHSGDIVEHRTAAEYAWVLGELKEAQLSAPFCVAPGNHDVGSRSLPGDEGYRLYKSAFGPTDYWLSCANALFVFFDDADEVCHPEDLQWLESTLARLRDQYTLCFVTMHVPPRDPRPGHAHSLREGADQLMAILTKHHVNAVFAGHIHGYLEDNVDGIPVYISGGEGADLDIPESGFHYLLCTVNKDDTLQVVKRDVPARADNDYAERVFRTKFQPDLALLVGAVLMTTGLIRLGHGRLGGP